MKVFATNIYNNKYYSNQNANKASFGATNRWYKLDSYSLQVPMGTYTNMFRDDVNWFELAKLEHELFKDNDKVNIVQFAASSGAEAYTKIISLLETASAEKTEKFFPIRAYDIDSVIIDLAKSGFINLSISEGEDFAKNNCDIKKYFKRNWEKLTLESHNGNIVEKTYVAKDILKDRVAFMEGDMFKLVNEIQDNSNTIVLCRNSLAYFNPVLQEKFIQDISSKLNGKSLFIIGDLDADFGVIPYLKKYNFKEIMKNVFQKVDYNPNIPEKFVARPQITVSQLLKTRTNMIEMLKPEK